MTQQQKQAALEKFAALLDKQDARVQKMKEQGELRDTRWLSAGYQDLLGVCMRLAVADAMYKEEKPFLILDDPFVNLDKEKVAAGNQLLLEVAKEYQVIYFTCHDSRSPVKQDVSC